MRDISSKFVCLMFRCMLAHVRYACAAVDSLAINQNLFTRLWFPLRGSVLAVNRLQLHSAWQNSHSCLEPAGKPAVQEHIIRGSWREVHAQCIDLQAEIANAEYCRALGIVRDGCAKAPKQAGDEFERHILRTRCMHHVCVSLTSNYSVLRRSVAEAKMYAQKIMC